MGSKSCMNQLCRATTSSEWKKGWILKSGGFATLCHNCGSAYENSIFCETFHSDESGWRECKICGKLVHCGCIASRYLHEYMDLGGISCASCSKRSEIHSLPSIQSRDNISSGKFVPKSGIRDANPIVVKNRIEEDKFSTERLMQLTNAIGVNNVTSTLDKFKREEPIPKFPNTSQHSSSVFAKDDNKSRSKSGVKDMFESLAQPSTNFSLTVPFAGQKIVEGSEPSKGADSEHGTKTRHIFPRPPKPTPLGGSETNKGAVSQVRVARPPVDGRGRNQLLPRYWPRITDQELQQLSGDLKSTIVPLFEKILSASDAGRIGRLVLPKACAEAYFPSINQSEGIPIKIQDIKGKEWIFQFRFWPNNNSRMYVLEGVTPCIQNMQLQAGDTVIFSRIDPGGQLVIGCRKATNNVDVQEPQTSTFPNDSPGETPVSDNLLSNGVKASDDSLQQHLTLSEKKKARNIKNKRLLVNNNEAMDLRVTWDEAQELFRPSPSADRTVFVIEDQEFEEFEEPPVFGKRTVFVSGPSGEQEQVAQCGSCSKWRRLPVDALLSANWTCSDNIWDSTRCSCSAPEDINSRDLDMFGVNKDYKKRRISSGEGEPSGLDALANAAVLGGDNIGDMGEYAVEAAATTTRHPRHRPGCTCIVCIQPPSGKGKHEPTCKCNVCLTVRRRFKTLMMRKKKRQSDREAELELALEKMGTNNNNNNNNSNNNNNNNNSSNHNSLVGDPPPTKVELESEDIVGEALVSMNYQREENEGQNGNKMDLEETSKGQELDLNCDPRREDEVLLEEASRMSLTALMNAATFPLDVYSVPQASNALEENVVGVESEKNREDG